MAGFQSLRSSSMCPVSCFDYGTHEFSELVLARIPEPLLSPVRGNLESCGGKNVRARLG